MTTRVRWMLLGAAAAIALITGTSSAFADETGSADQVTDRFTIQIAPLSQSHRQTAGGSLSASGLLQQRPAGARPLGALTPLTGQDDMTVEECRAQTAAFSGLGYGKSRFISCQAATLLLTHLRCTFFFGCQVIGEASVDVTDFAHGNNVFRSVDVIMVLGNWLLAGDIEGLILLVQVQCSGVEPCSPVAPFGSPSAQSVANWVAEGSVTSRFFEFSQPSSVGIGPDLISFANFNMHFALSGPGAASSGPVDGPQSRFRCDSALYLPAEGCIFDWVTESLDYSLTGNEAAVAAHVAFAQQFPDLTVPPAVSPPKFIPGAPGGFPLHRTVDQQAIDAHRATALAACNEFFPGYAANGDQCDEYPFASTEEGADPLTNDFSVLPVPAADNASAGGKLGSFVTLRRILGNSPINDPYFVQVDP